MICFILLFQSTGMLVYKVSGGHLGLHICMSPHGHQVCTLSALRLSHICPLESLVRVVLESVLTV